MLPTTVELPPAEAPTQGVLASARQLDGEWWRGVKFRTDGCAEPTLQGPCPADVAGSPIRPDEATFWPVAIRQGASCSALSGTDVELVASRRLDWSREWAVARELQTGFWSDRDAPPGADGNPSLAGGVVVEAGNHAPTRALALLEQAGSNQLHGQRLFLHSSPLIASFLLEAGTIWRDGRRWRTVLGNVLVVSPGYQGVDLYVTGEVFAATARREVLLEHDRTVNDSIAWADEVGIAVFDPCWHGRVSTDITDLT